MKKIFTTLFVAAMAFASMAEGRSWNFVLSADNADSQAIQASSLWTEGSKGRWTNANAITDAQLMIDETTPLACTAGLYFTADASKILMGCTNNYYLQTNGNVTIRIPECAAGDSLILGISSSSSSKNYTITFTNAEAESYTTEGSSKTTFQTVVPAAGDVILTCASGIRFFTMEVVTTEDTTTAIEEVENAPKSAVSYDLFGRISDSKGFKVANGKVILVK